MIQNKPTVAILMATYNGENGSKFVEKEFGDEAVWKKLAKVLSDLGFTISRRNYSLSLYR